MSSDVTALRYRLLDTALACDLAPEALLRAGSRCGARARERELRRGGIEAHEQRQRELLARLRSGPIAERPETAAAGLNLTAQRPPVRRPDFASSDPTTPHKRIVNMRIKALILPAAVAIVVAVVALALGNHGGRSSGSHSSAVALNRRAITVAISNFAYHPDVVTVRAGTRVTWTNHDATAHTATANDGQFDTATLDQGQSRTIDFKRPGTYAYHCIYHAFMTGTIKVVR